MRLLTQRHAPKDMRTLGYRHTHSRLQTLFAEAMCWDGDRGLAVGRQTADTVLWHQTFQFRISLSCLLTLSLSCTRAKTCALGAHACARKHNNAHFLWSHCQNSKTLKVWHSRANTYTAAYSQALKSEYNFISHCWNALCEMRKHVSSVIWKWFQIFLFPVKSPVRHRDLFYKHITHVRACHSHPWTVHPVLQCSIQLNFSAGHCVMMHKIKHHIGSHMLRRWSCSDVQLPKQISMKMKTQFPPAKKSPQTPSNIDSSGKARSRPAISAKSFLRLRSSSARTSLNLRWVCMLWKRTWEIKYRKATLLLVSMLPSMLRSSVYHHVFQPVSEIINMLMSEKKHQKEQFQIDWLWKWTQTPIISRFMCV